MKSASHPSNQWEAAEKETEKSKFGKIFQREDIKKNIVETLIVNVIEAKSQKAKNKAEQTLKNVLDNIEKRNMKKQIEEDEKLGLKLLQEDRKQEKNKEENDSINSIRFLEQPMVNERRIGHLNGPLYSPSLGETKGRNQVTSLSGNRPNTTLTNHSSTKTYAKSKLVKKPDGQTQFQDLRYNEDSPDYDHEEIIMIED